MKGGPGGAPGGGGKKGGAAAGDILGPGAKVSLIPHHITHNTTQ